MSGPGDINIVIAQAHLVSEMHNLLKQNMQIRKQIADQVEAKRRQEKKSRVESTDTENRIETEDGSFGEERRPAGPNPAMTAGLGPRLNREPKRLISISRFDHDR
jgi:hypothetical protein